MIKNQKATWSSKVQQFHLPYLAYMLLIGGLYLITLYGTSYSFYMFIPLLLAFIPIFINGIQDILQKQVTTEFFLIFATGIAVIAGQQDVITAVLLIMMVAKYAEKFIEERTGKAIESLVRLIPTIVVVKTDQGEKEVAIDAIKPGMKIVVKTGGQIPVDGTVLTGQADINESFLTGESNLQEKQQGDVVFAGTFVEGGSIVIRVDKIAQDTYFGKVGRLLEQAEQEKADIVTLANKVAFISIIVLTVFIAGVWIVTADLTLVATLLVFGSPIELTLITPLAVLAGTAAAFRYGIIVKGGSALERFAGVTTVVFDKTGTLTVGQPTVASIDSFHHDYDKNAILRIAAILEKRAGHVVAKAILKKAAEEKLTIPDPEVYESLSGHGVEGVYRHKRYILGSEHFIGAPEHGNTAISDDILLQEKPSVSYFYLACDGVLCGRIGVTDVIRPDAQTILTALHNGGVKHMILLSGDRKEVAEHIAQQLGIEESHGEIAPDEKLAMIKTLQSRGEKVAMIGDGINDAPALKQADVGIAMGAMGMEPAIEAADIVLTSNDLYGIVFIYRLAQKTMRLIKQNIIFGFFFVHILGIILALIGVVSPIQAALFHAFSDVLVLINSALLIRFSYKKE